MPELLNALELCSNSERDFSRSFSRQFVLTEQSGIALPGWQTEKLGDWSLYHCPFLKTVELKAKSGAVIGFVLGRAIDPSGTCVNHPQVLPSDPSERDFWECVDRHVIALAGRYIVVVSDGTEPRVYTDPVADYGVVYDPFSRMVASTLTLTLQRPIHPNPIFPWAKVRTNQLQYSLGHTRDFSVKRLLGNHFLGLRDFRARRFWPREDTDLDTREVEQTPEIIEAIYLRLSQNMRALLSGGDCILPLSGGRDSRCLLGASLADIQKAQFIFSWRFHRQSGLDAETAKLICERLGLEHRTLLFQKTTFKDRQDYFLSSGYATFGPELRTLSFHEKLPENLTILRGNIMGILRATNWARQEEGRLNLEHAIKRLRINGADATDRPSPAVWQNAFLEWYETLPPQGQNKVHDLAWLDITLPHNQGARWHGFPQHFYMNPFCDRHLLALSMQLPLKTRKKDEAYSALVQRATPSLKDIPFV